MKHFRVIAFCVQSFCLLVIAGCGSTYQVYKENLSLLFSSDEPPALSWADVTNSRFDLISLETGNNTGSMALAFLEHGEHKFIGADNSFLILRSGRLVRSSGFNNDVSYVGFNDIDPLTQPLVSNAARWQFSMQNADGLAQSFSSVWSEQRSEILREMDTDFATVVWTEEVKASDGAHFTNIHWFDESGTILLKTVQHMPSAEPVSIVFLSRLNRLREE